MADPCSGRFLFNQQIMDLASPAHETKRCILSRMHLAMSIVLSVKVGAVSRRRL